MAAVPELKYKVGDKGKSGETIDAKDVVVGWQARVEDLFV